MTTGETRRAEPDDAPAPLRFERRRTDRWPANGVARAFEIGGTSFGRTHTLSVVDCSDGGFGAVSDTVLTPGTEISVDFHAPGHPPRRGVVSRCRPCGHGYRLAVIFELRLAA